MRREHGVQGANDRSLHLGTMETMDMEWKKDSALRQSMVCRVQEALDRNPARAAKANRGAAGFEANICDKTTSREQYCVMIGRLIALLDGSRPDAPRVRLI